MELITHNSYDRRHKQSTIPPALAKHKEIEEEPIQKYNQNIKPINTATQHKRKTTADSVDNKTGVHNTHARQKPRNAITVKK